MKLSLSFDGTESRDIVERAVAAALLFTGHTAVIGRPSDAPTVSGPDRDIGAIGFGFGVTVDGGAAGDDEHDEGGAPASTVAGANVNLDKDGLPHDPRIHSKNATINADGRWKKRRGVEDAEVTAVEAELRALVGAANAVPPPPAASAPVAAPPPPPAAAAAAAPPPPPPAASAPAAAPPPPPAAAAAAPATDGAPAVHGFGTLLRWISFQTAANKLAADDVASVCLSFGHVNAQGVGAVSQLGALAPEKSVEVYNALKAIVAENGG